MSDWTTNPDSNAQFGPEESYEALSALMEKPRMRTVVRSRGHGIYSLEDVPVDPPPAGTEARRAG